MSGCFGGLRGLMPMQATGAPKLQAHRPDVTPTLLASALPGSLRMLPIIHTAAGVVQW